jgi:superfamily II DNA helicase RecQ
MRLVSYRPGAGKSPGYPLPALFLDGTVVVSPLIALIQDQLEHLEEHEMAARSRNVVLLSPLYVDFLADAIALRS